MEPDHLVLDEPFTGLDEPARRSVLDRLRELRAAGTSVIVVTTTSATCSGSPIGCSGCLRGVSRSTPRRGGGHGSAGTGRAGSGRSVRRPTCEHRRRRHRQRYRRLVTPSRTSLTTRSPIGLTPVEAPLVAGRVRGGGVHVHDAPRARRAHPSRRRLPSPRRWRPPRPVDVPGRVPGTSGRPLVAGATLGTPWFRVDRAATTGLASYRVLLILVVAAGYVRSTPVRDSRAAIQRSVRESPASSSEPASRSCSGSSRC